LVSISGCTGSDPQSADDYTRTIRARAFLENGQPSEAIKLLRAVAEDRPGPEVYCNLGLALTANKDVAKAVEAFRKSLSLQPDHVRSNYHLAALELQLARDRKPDQSAAMIEGARESLERARTFEPHNASILRLLSEAYRAQGKTSDADSLLLVAEHYDPDRAGRVAEANGLNRIVVQRFERSPSVTRHAPRFHATPLQAQARGLTEVPLASSTRASSLLLEGTRAWLRNTAIIAPENIQWAAQSLLPTTVLGGISAPFTADAIFDMLLWSRPEDTRAATSGRTQLWFATGGQDSMGVQPLQMLPFEMLALHAMDLDADGDVDLVMCASDKPGLRVWRNDGKGDFSTDEDATWFADALPMRDIHAADLNGDEITDLVTINQAGGVHVWAGRRHGHFSDVTHQAGLDGVRARSLATADLDADGLADLLVGDDEALWIHINRGNMTFERNAAYRDARGEWSGEQERGVPVASIQVVDFDNDGKLDVISQHFRDPQAQRVVARRSHGTSMEASHRNEDTAPRRQVALLEVPQEVRLALWRNEGHGILTDVTVRAGLDAQRTRPAAPVIADFDLDGDLDLACIGIEDRVLLLWNSSEGLNRRIVFEWGDVVQQHRAFGAQVYAYSGRRVLQSATSQGMCSLGFGTLEHIDVLRISWADGTVKNLFDVNGLRAANGGQQRLVLPLQP
jgi:Flp pilus assembly protein TadD